MPNYRYNMPEYERRNTCGNAYRQRPSGYAPTREACSVPQGCGAERDACSVAQGCAVAGESLAVLRGSREGFRMDRAASEPACAVEGKSLGAVRRSRMEAAAGELSCAVENGYDALSDMPIAMAYVPWQSWQDIYEVEKAFCRGTIFEELDKPFRGMGGAR